MPMVLARAAHADPRGMLPVHLVERNRTARQLLVRHLHAAAHGVDHPAPQALRGRRRRELSRAGDVRQADRQPARLVAARLRVEPDLRRGVRAVRLQVVSRRRRARRDAALRLHRADPQARRTGLLVPPRKRCSARVLPYVAHAMRVEAARPREVHPRRRALGADRLRRARRRCSSGPSRRISWRCSRWSIASISTPTWRATTSAR